MSPLGSRLWGVARLEWRRQLSPARVLWLLILGAAPVAMMGIVAWTIVKFGHEDTASQMGENFGNFYHGMIVRVVLFFGCATIFLGQIRGELEQRSWHYSLLTPVPRWQLVLGKYLAGVVIGWLFFALPGGLSRAIYQIPFGLSGLGDWVVLKELLTYVVMSALGCLAYGGFFLAVGTLLRGPGYLVAVFFVFEWMQFLLPPVLKQLSVVYYLRALTPVPLSEGPFALLADPVPAWLVVLQLLIYAFVAVVLSAWKVSRSELDYRTK